jgi:protein CpxP
LVLILILINIGLLSFIFQSNNQHPHPKRNRNLIIEKLKLSDSQITKYDSLIKIHRNGINPAQHQLMDLKNTLYSNLKSEMNAEVNDSIILEINKIQNNIEHIHMNHFVGIKFICTAQQQTLYNELTTDLAKLFISAAPPKQGR